MVNQTRQVVEGWTGPGRRDEHIEPLKLAEDGLHIDPGQKGLYEWWYFDAHLETGHTIVVFFHASNPNPGLEGKTGIEFVLIQPDGKRLQKFFAHSKSEFSADRDRPEVKIGENTLKVDQPEGGLPVYEIEVYEKDLGCHLKYTAQVNGWKPGTGLSHFGDLGYFGWVVPFARASVEGTITEGKTTIPVEGIGYHDHNWLNFPFPRIIDYWMWGRVYSKSYTLAYAYIQCNAKVNRHSVQVLMLADGQEVILSTGEFDLIKENFEFNAKAGYQFPRKMILRVPLLLEATLQVIKVFEAQDMLANYHPVLRFIARNILRLKPGYFRLLSKFELEVKQGDQPITETGTTLHEIVLFQPLNKKPA
jgi:hypothetical protein